jgi:hypothetical protein
VQQQTINKQKKEKIIEMEIFLRVLTLELDLNVSIEVFRLEHMIKERKKMCHVSARRLSTYNTS